MAIQKSTLVSQYGINLPESYIKIDDVRISDKEVTYFIKTFADKAARDTNAQPLTVMSFACDYTYVNTLEGDDLIAKLYAFTKEVHPEFKTDTLDV